MSEAREAAGQRDRSPSFPFIPLKTAIERLTAFEEHHKRAQVPPDRVGLAWGMKANSSQAQQTIAALKAFGLLQTQLSAAGRGVIVSEAGRTYLRAQQDSVKREVLQQAALRPRQIETHWKYWGTERPKDAACLDQLVLTGHFSPDGAEKFLRVYDETIAYAGLSDSDKIAPDPEEDPPEEPGEGEDREDDPPPSSAPRSTAPPAQDKVRLMEGERELTTGLLSKEASFRLIVNGRIGVKEIEMLIKKLQLDKEILANEEQSREETKDERP